MRSACIAACLVLLVAAALPPLCSADQNTGGSAQSLLPYTLTPVGFVSGYTDASRARGINDLGQVVGTSSGTGGTTRAFLWDGGAIQTLGTLGGTGSGAYGINESSQIAGWTTLSDGTWRAFRYDSGTMVALDLVAVESVANPGTYWYPNRGGAWAINDSGQVAGVAYHDNYGGDWTYAAKWAGTGTSGVSLGTREGYGINNAGDVAGWYAAVTGSGSAASAKKARIWNADGTQTEIGTLGGTQSWAYAINDSRQVVGISITATTGVIHAFLWDNGNMQNLGGLSGHNWSWASGINENGVVVGTSQPDASTPGRAFLWKDGVGMVDLNNYLDDSYAGWTLRHAYAINNNGQIVGWGTNPDGKTEAFVLTPVPEPTSLLVLAVGITGLLARRRK